MTSIPLQQNSATYRINTDSGKVNKWIDKIA